MQVPYEQTFFAIAEQRMNRPDRPVEWYAFGCSGFGTTQDYLAIRHYVLDYQPDVVVMLFIANDLADCSPYIAKQAAFNATMHVDDEGRLILTPAKQYRPSRLRRILAKSAIVRYLWLQNPIWGPQPVRRGEFVREGASAAVTASMDASEREERFKKTWALIEALLRECRDECARRGAVFAVAWRGNVPVIKAAEQDVAYQPQPKEIDPYCMNQRLNDAGEDFIAPIASRLGIPYLDLTEPIVEKVRATGRIHDFPDDGHFGPVGHAAAAEAMAAWLEGLLDGAASGTQATPARVEKADIGR